MRFSPSVDLLFWRELEKTVAVLAINGPAIASMFEGGGAHPAHYAWSNAE
jgi:hypothetical protein